MEYKEKQIDPQSIDTTDTVVLSIDFASISLTFQYAYDHMINRVQ